jgi:hypothetical protein
MQWLHWSSGYQTEAPVRRCQDPNYLNECATEKFKLATSLNNVTWNEIKENDLGKRSFVIYECLNFIADLCKYIIFPSFQKKYNLWNGV